MLVWAELEYEGERAGGERRGRGGGRISDR